MVFERAWEGLPFFLFGLAVLLAVWFSYTEGEHLKQTVASLFILLLGSALLVWGLQAIQKGAIRLKRRTATADENPLVFWAMVLLFRFLIGGILFVAGIWRLW